MLDIATSWEGSLIFLCLLAMFVSWLIAIQYWLIIRVVRWREPEPAESPVHLSVGPLSVIIPARDEEQDLAESLRTVLAQQDVELQVIVVNDHSRDRTGQIADSIAATDRRVIVLHDPELQTGWLGKVNAMQHGLMHAKHELLVFTDADILHAPGCFASALTALKRHQLDFVSFSPRIRCVSLIENANVPLYLGGFVHLWREALQPGSTRAMAAGAFILVPAGVLRAVGGLAAIKTESLDDVMLATVIRRHGFHVKFWTAPGLVQVRLFKGNWQAWWGLTKNILAELQGRMLITVVSAVFPCLVFLTPLLAAVLGAIQGNWILGAVGLFTYATQYLLLLPAREIFHLHYGKLLCFPLVSLVFLSTFTRAMYYHLVHGAVLWRGRSIRVRGDDVAGPVEP